MSDDKQSDVVVTEFAPTLGRQLREARESKDMSITEVATQLRLTKDVVAQLESDQWDKMRGRIYARGYFVSYVKFLQLPYNDMMALFDYEYTVSDPALKLNHHRQPVQERSFPWLLLISLLLITVIVWVGYQQWQASQQAQEAEVSQVTEESVIEESAESLVVESPVVESVEQPVIADNNASETDLMPTPEAANSTASPTASEDSTSLDDLSLSESVSAEAQAELAPVDTEQSASETTTAADRLNIAFNANCWVQIRNGQAGVLVNKVMRAGETLSFESDEPFNISLGRANAATVTFNDETVDLTAFTRGDVARFTLGEES